MRVLHIAAGSRGSDARATAEVLVATMASQDPGVHVDELNLAATAPAVTRDHGAAARGVAQRADPGDGARRAVVERVLAADVIVLSVDGAARPGSRDRLGWMLEALTRPDALRARAEVRRAGRRVGRRVSRRMVIVAPPARDAHDSRDLAELVPWVQNAFRSVDVVEFGVIAGG